MTGTEETRILEGLEDDAAFLATLPSLSAVHWPSVESDDDSESESRVLVHSEQPLPCGKHSQSNSLDSTASEQRDVVAELDADEARYHACDHRAITEVKHVENKALFNLPSLLGHQRMLLASFLKRWGRNKWMRAQDMYIQEASLAAAHSAMGVYAAFNQGRRENGIIESHEISPFNGNGFLNCGRRVKTRNGTWEFIRCGQPFYCRACNRWHRVEPAKDEFVPKFNAVPSWYSITITGVSNPRRAGVKLRLGLDRDGNPVDRWLYRLSDDSRISERLPKFGIDDFDRPRAVADATYRCANWLTDNGYFRGLHAVPDVDFTFFPDRVAGVAHTINCHIHGYGNSDRVIDETWAGSVYNGATCCAAATGALEFVYMDIMLRPAPTPPDLRAAINYALKPFRFAEWYVEALRRGCPVVALNHEFHQVVFGAEQLFAVGAAGTMFGNMSMKAGGHYIGRPPLAAMSKQQVKRYKEKEAADDLWPWEIERFERHLEFMRRKRRRQRTPEWAEAS